MLLFLEGFTTFISPCLLPLLPVYISYFAAGNSGTKGTLIGALGFVSGFSAVFIALGAFAGTLGALLWAYEDVVNVVTGCIVVVLGLNFLGVIRIGFLNKTVQMHQKTPKKHGFLQSALFGVVFSVGWTPCVGAFLGAALMKAASNGGTAEGALLLLIYSLGLGIPFVLCAVLIDRLKGAFDFIKRHYHVINAVSGGLLVVMGVLMAFGVWGRIMSLLL